MKVHSQSRKEFPFLPYGIVDDLFISHNKQAFTNHSQTLERLNERGGLSPREMLAILCDCHYSKLQMSEMAAAKIIVYICDLLPYLESDYFSYRKDKEDGDE